jgi:hypothetical protein
MTAPLRRAHLRIWVVMAAALTVILAATILERPAEPGPNPVHWEDMR